MDVDLGFIPGEGGEPSSVYMFEMGLCNTGWKSVYVRSGGHDPVAIFGYSDAYRRALKVEVLEKFDSVLVLDIVLEAPLPPARKPVWESLARATGDCVHGHRIRIGELHAG